MNGQPDPKCRWCKGTGQIPLFTSSCECDCVKMTCTDWFETDLIKNLGIPARYFQDKFSYIKGVK